MVGYATTTALIKSIDILLNKPGGFLSNDIFPLTYVMDNMPAFEYGAIQQIRNFSLAMRHKFSRSQSQSLEDKDLVIAQNKLNISHTSWMLPSAESQYEEAVEALHRYRANIMNQQDNKAQFYARADNLAHWLDYVNADLGNISQRLSSSVPQKQLDLSLAGETDATQSTPTASVSIDSASWWKIDDNFYEARGTCWAVLNFMYAIEMDFESVLKKKNALVSVQQIIHILEATQGFLWSPMVLNGSNFGFVANHSLVMANYVSRANAALIDLTNLLRNG